MGELQILPMESAHLLQLHKAEIACFNAPWSISTLGDVLLNPNGVSLAAFLGEKLVGYGLMLNMEIVGESEIINIAVLPEYRSRRIGDALLRALIQRGEGKISLEVRASNEAARALYMKHNFVAKGLRKEYYKNPTEDAIIMWLEVNGEKT
ncbi:MAG: ribosomal protein S18-alanine N-acetyltransferase [Clostridiales bacterium]|jgi:ribosomal-protein-alanine N-acetyltransferase|nr:ribosomal protein S18-alanine N-acetyltransferase [Clostridiales bacterium]